MSLVKAGQQVEYYSTQTKTKTKVFKGRVLLIEDKYAVIIHATEPRVCHVAVARLKIVEPPRPRFAGRSA